MIDFEEELFQLSVCSDGHFDKNAVDPTWGCNEGSGYRNITLDNICKQMNLTLDEEDFEEQIGYTPRKVPTPKCLWTQRPLDFVYNKYNDTYNITEDAFKN